MAVTKTSDEPGLAFRPASGNVRMSGNELVLRDVGGHVEAHGAALGDQNGRTAG